MTKYIVPIPGYAHLYRSLLRFTPMSENEIKEMLYMLNIANLDCFSYYHPLLSVIESGPATFSQALDRIACRPYRTEVQLYKALEYLQRGLDKELMTSAQREALQKLCCVMYNIEYRFYRAFGIEIDDNRTVYSECAFSAVPKEDEPSVPIMFEWICLPTA